MNGETSVDCAGEHNSVLTHRDHSRAAVESACGLTKAQVVPLILTETPFVCSLPHVLSFLQPMSSSRWKTCLFIYLFFSVDLHKWHVFVCGHFYSLSSPKACLDEYQYNFPFNLVFEAKTDLLFFHSAKQVPDPRLSTHYCSLNKSHAHTHTPTIFSYPLATRISIFSNLLSQELFGGEHGARLINDIWSGYGLNKWVCDYSFCVSHTQSTEWKRATGGLTWRGSWWETIRTEVKKLGSS